MSVERGKTLSHYRLIEKIGEGGMGVVWKAEDTVLGRTVAIKVLPADHARDEKRRKMFFDEARLASSVSEAHIVQVHEFGHEGDLDFIVMEYVEGKPLHKILQGRPLPPERVVEIGYQVARALSKAHRKGLIHRDLKPANILITPDGDAKVVDFGLAILIPKLDLDSGTAVLTRSVGEKTVGRTENVEAVTVTGTIPYMSPEQVRGEELDLRSDIFSLGSVLYEMTTGQRPFRGATSKDVVSEVLKTRPKPVHQVVAEVPLELARIITKSLAPRPGDRYQNTEDLVVDLKRLGRDLEAGSSPSYEELGKGAPPPPKRRWWVGATALMTAAAIGIVFGFWQFLPKTETISTGRKMIVVLPFENLGSPEDEYFTSGMTEEITSRLAMVSNLGVISRTSSFQYDRAGKSIKRIGEDFGVDYVLEGTVRWARESTGTSRIRVTPQLIRVSDDTHLWAENYDQVINDIFQVQSEIAAAVIEKIGVALLDPERRAIDSEPTGNLEAYDSYLRGNEFLNRGRELSSAREIHFAIQMYEEAIRLDRTFALAYARKAEAHIWLYTVYEDRTDARLANAKEAVNRALELNPGLPEAHLALGMIYNSGEGDSDRALEEYRTVLRSQPNNAEVFEAISEVHEDLGQWEEGLANLKRAMELNPRLGRLPCSAGGIAFGLRDFGEALHLHDRAIRLTPDRACPYWCKLFIYLNRDGSTENARSFLAQIPQSVGLEETPPINYPWVMVDMMDGRYEEALSRLSSGSTEAFEFGQFYIPKDQLAAQIYGLMDRPELEAIHYEAAHAMLMEKIREYPNDDRIHGSLGIAYAGLGRDEDAIREGRLGIELLGGTRDNKLGYRLKDLAQIYVMMGDHDEAINHLERLLSVPALFSAPYLKADPTWLPLRDDPRFQDLLQRMNFPG
ncbi:MAG: protein kinase [Gammaproteobacteria bacterium]|nr:protein kinase [Gammaproteobacteria bacterium]